MSRFDWGSILHGHLHPIRGGVRSSDNRNVDRRQQFHAELARYALRNIRVNQTRRLQQMKTPNWTIKRLWSRKGKRWHVCAVLKGGKHVVPFPVGHDLSSWLERYENHKTAISTGYCVTLRREYLSRKPSKKKP